MTLRIIVKSNNSGRGDCKIRRRRFYRGKIASDLMEKREKDENDKKGRIR